jgi:hypothetical protein
MIFNQFYIIATFHYYFCGHKNNNSLYLLNSQKNNVILYH